MPASVVCNSFALGTKENQSLASSFRENSILHAYQYSQSHSNKVSSRASGRKLRTAVDLPTAKPPMALMKSAGHYHCNSDICDGP